MCVIVGAYVFNVCMHGWSRQRGHDPMATCVLSHVLMTLPSRWPNSRCMTLDDGFYVLSFISIHDLSLLYSLSLPVSALATVTSRAAVLSAAPPSLVLWPVALLVRTRTQTTSAHAKSQAAQAAQTAIPERGYTRYDKQYLKVAIPTLVWGTTAPLGGCCSRRPRKEDAAHLLLLRHCGSPEHAGSSRRGSSTTIGSQNAPGPVTLGGPSRIRGGPCLAAPALDPPAWTESPHARA